MHNSSCYDHVVIGSGLAGSVSAMRLIGTSFADFIGVPLADRTAGPPIIAEAGHRLFFDLTPVVRSRMGRTIAPRVLDFMEKRSAVVLRELFDDPRLSVVHPRRGPVVRRVLRVAARNHIPPRLIRSPRRYGPSCAPGCKTAISRDS